MISKAKRRTNISSPSPKIYLICSFFLILSFIIVAILMYKYNIRRATPLEYNTSKHSVMLESDYFKNSNEVYLADNWIIVPNIEPSDLSNGLSLSFNRYKKFPHIENATITTTGWSDTGTSPTYINMAPFTKFEKAAYMMIFNLEENEDILYLNIPAVNGLGHVYCNGKLMAEFGNEAMDDAPFFDFTCGNLNMAINKSNERTIELIIFVESEFNVDKCGITAYPSIGNYTANNRFNIFSNAWFFFEVAIFIISAFASLILSNTFRFKAKRYLFLGDIILMLSYICVDNNYLSISTRAHNTALFIILICHSIVSYAFTNSIFSYQSTTKSFIRRWHDTFIIAFMGIALILPQYFIDASSSYSDLNGVSIFILISATLLLGKTIFIIYKEKKREKNSVLALFTALSTFFVYLCTFGDTMYVYYIPVYSVYFSIALIALQIIFIIYYVLQFNELALAKVNLQELVDLRTSQLSKANEELRKANADLLENEIARKNVMSNISHDLKTPITAIKGYAQLLSTSEVVNNPDQVTSYSENIIRRANQMERLIADIIELTKLQSGGLSFKMIPISVSQMLEETYYMYEPDVSIKGKKLELSIPEEDYLMVNADPNKLVRIFENLISNAIHYTNEKGEIKIKAFRDGKKNEGNVVIEVSDNGIGIPEEDKAHIFDRFYRAKNSGINIKGTGLGLAIVKLIAEKHNGQIEVDSVINEGTTFRLILPAQELNND